MRAVRLNAFGLPARVEEMSMPVPADDEVLVHVRAASVNPVDWKIAAGYLGDYFPVPRTMGQDFSGDVEAAGKDVTSLKPGDAVFGMKSGSMADYITVKADEIALKPKSLDHVQAVALGMPALCAHQALFEVAHVQAGDRVLIHGAGGGVGVPAIQLAKRKGAVVIVNAHNGQADLFRELAVDEFVDADEQRFEEYAGDVDVILDLVGNEYIDRSLDFCRPDTRYVTPAAFLPPDAGKSRGVFAAATATHPSAADMAELAEAADAGQLRAVVSRTFPVEEAQQALDLIQRGGTRGRVILTFD
ncbi:MAG: NADP-dependent oxidoreductase [Candidatus Promineofilum sp.]|nr:NADP-dependent oxidoreductase [Promineifilum sp.]